MITGLVDIERQVRRSMPFGVRGHVSRMVGQTVSVASFPASFGAICRIELDTGASIEAEVVGFHENETLLVPYDPLGGIRRGNRVRLVQSVPVVRVGDRLLGRVIDARGRFLDARPPAACPHRVDLHAESQSPLRRPPIHDALSTGVRAIDGLLTCGKGQRLGIFSGSGVGKSVLMGQMARSSSADVNVVVMVGERGREVREFIERDLGPDGLARTVLVIATSDEPALMRLRSAFLGTAIAEYFRDTGRDVLLMMDSVTRFALAQREIGLSAGEPPATRGYPPSVFAMLPRLLERSGRTERGSITAFYTVLVEGDDTNEPVADSVRGILDGHVVLSRRLAEAAHWPAIDVLSSISRSMNAITTEPHQKSAQLAKRLLAAYAQSEDLINIGAYKSGSNSIVDQAIRLRDSFNGFLRQGPREASDFNETVSQLQNLANSANHPNAVTGVEGSASSSGNSKMNSSFSGIPAAESK
ncbi:MAG: FliI/YscN family ATPase [Planctomycetota bacterium]|nr:FliI/YscN family ATPase [Planctomycetota bacterium]